MTHVATRRALLKIGAAAGGGLVIGCRLMPRARAAAGPEPKAAFAPNAFIRIGSNGRISFIMSHTECGQGIYTSASMLIAEELGVRLDQITLEHAPPDAALYTDPLNGEQATGGSTSTITGWVPLRQAGAAARMLLVQAAARCWKVDVAACTAAAAMVTHTATGRQLGYGALAEAAAKLPAPKTVALKDMADFALIGTRQRRLDTPGKIDGSLRYGIDVQLPGMKIGTVAASPVRGGRLRHVNEAAARAIPGVREIVCLDNAVAIIGDHMWAAITGLRAADPVWDDGPNARMDSAGLVAALAEASNAEGVAAKQTGDARAAIAGAARRLEATYQLPFLAHAPMEPINTTIHIRQDGADLWVGTQVPVRARDAVAQATGLPAGRVTVHNQYMGGAFGRRLEVDSIQQAASIAKHVPYPVKLIWTREEDIQQDMVRPYYYDRLSAGLDAKGRITGWTHRVTGSSVTARYAPDGMDKNGTLDPDAVESAAETPYDLPAQLTQYVRAEPNGVATSWWRGVGPTHNVFVVESFIDELAHLAGADPVAFRRAHLARNPRALAVLNLAAAKAGWGTPLPRGRGRGVALQHAFGSLVASVAEVSVSEHGDIALHSVHSAVDCGPVVNPDTVEAQIQGGMIFGLSAALYSEISHGRGRVLQTNFDNYRVLRMAQAPQVFVHIAGDPASPIGGIGEAGTASAAPALANAVFAACGKRVRRLPVLGGGVERV